MKIKKLRDAALLLLCSMLMLGSTPAFAAPSKSPSSPTANSQQLKISPVRTDITIAAGTTGTVKVVVTNMTNSALIVEPIENDFVAGNESGQPSLILDPGSYAPSHSLKRFMVPLSNVTLPPKGSAPVTVTITVPKTAQAGGYFGALRFAPLVGGVSGPSAVALGASAASLILMTVPGPTVEQMTLTNFDVQQNGGTATNFRTPKDLELLLRFENKGNIQEAPFGQINVQKGKKVVYTYNFNQENPKNEVLPDSARRWQVPLKNLGKFGKYTVSGTFSYGTKGQALNIQKTVWIIPSAYILAVVIAIVVLVAIIGGAWVFLRNYKRRILRSSRRRY